MVKAVNTLDRGAFYIRGESKEMEPSMLLLIEGADNDGWLRGVVRQLLVESNQEPFLKDIR